VDTVERNGQHAIELDASSVLAQARFGAPYQAFMLLLDEALTTAEVQDRLALRFGAYTAALQDAIAGDGSVGRLTETYRECLDCLQDAMAAAHVADRIPTAFRRYVAGLQSAWIEVDVDVIDASQLIAIAQSMTSIGWLSEAAIAAYVPSLVGDVAGEVPSDARPPFVAPSFRDVDPERGRSPLEVGSLIASLDRLMPATSDPSTNGTGGRPLGRPEPDQTGEATGSEADGSEEATFAFVPFRIDG
jgi:hypothetical protein